MFKIIMGCGVAEEYLPNGMYLELFTHAAFDDEVCSEWLADPFCQEIIREINHAKVVAGTAIQSLETDDIFSPTELCGGTKFLISVYKNQDPNRVFMTYMGDNCMDFLERIASKYNKDGRDLIIVADYMYLFEFKYIDKIYYINWNETCYSKDDIFDKIYDKFIEQQSKLYKLGAYREEDDDDDFEDDNEEND